MMLRPAVVILALCLAGCSGGADGDSENDGLVGWWKLDEGAGSTANDASGRGNAATIRNGRWADGQTGSALEMSGTVVPDPGDDAIVVVPLSDSLRATAREITLMSWTYRTATHNVAIVAHEYPVLFFGFHGTQFKWQFQGEPATGLLARTARRLGVTAASGDRVRDLRGASCYADLSHVAALDRWIHVAATYDGWRARLYVDGVEICERGFWGSIRMPDGPFTIGAYLNEQNEIVDEISGKLDDVRIYDRALDEAEIRSIYMRAIE